MKRWKSVIVYRTENGPVDVEHEIEELSELEAIVERGPDWNTIVNIDTRLQRVHFPGDTIEKAAKR